MSTVSRQLTAMRRRHPWPVFCCRRTVRLAVSLFLVATGSFVMIRMVPGDPVRAALGVDAAPDVVAARRHELGLDENLTSQYLRYLGDLAQGRLGVSLVTGEPVTELVRSRLPATLEIAFLAFGCALAIALPVGLAAAILTRDGRRPGAETGFTATTGLVAALPDFVLAAGLTAAFAVGLRLFPVAGDATAASYVLPVLALALAPAAALTRLVRAETLKVLGEEYVRTARAKRLPAAYVHVRHVAPNMLTATLTVAGSLLPAMIAGTVLVEKVFAWPGIGSAIAQSVVAQDYAVVQAAVLILGASVLVVGFAVDVLLALLDPRSAIRET